MGEPTDVMAEAILRDAAATGCNRVVAIGGGTVIDIAKVLAVGGGESIDELYGMAPELPKRRELVLIPTTCGTGSEVTNISILNRTRLGTKMGLVGPAMYADAAVLIPQLLEGLPFGVFATSSIDALVLTHLHADHANGAERLLARIDVGTLYMPGDPDDSDGLLEGILAAAERHGTEVVYVSESDLSLTLGGLELTLFKPLEAGDENERGVVALASIGDFDALVMGDINSSAERELVSTRALPDTELLVVGHHGSKYATSEELLLAARPETAVISVGYNSYGHPAPETLERLAAAGCAVYRTDWSGTVTITAT